MYVKDIEVNIIFTYHQSPTLKERYCFLENITIALKYMDKEKFSKLFTSYITPKLDYHY